MLGKRSPCAVHTRHRSYRLKGHLDALNQNINQMTHWKALASLGIGQGEIAKIIRYTAHGCQSSLPFVRRVIEIKLRQ